MKYLQLVLLCLLTALPLFAQEKNVYTIKGQIVEKESGNTVPYATVILANDSLQIKKMMACDAAGNFKITADRAADYTLTASAVGFRQMQIPVTIVETTTNLGKLNLEEGTELQAVTVTAQKPLVKIEVDKLVYSIESDPESKTNNTLEMLSKVPLITVDGEENITLNGQSNFKVLVDGKSSSMMSNNLKEVLKSLPANTIKDIEVITNPSSKYDAEGVAGIINIITNKKSLNGYNASLSTGIDTRGSINGSAYMAVKIKKVSFSARYYASEYKQPKSEFENIRDNFQSDEYYHSLSEGFSKYSGYSGGFSGEGSYEIDSLNLISLSFWGYQGSYRNSGITETSYSNSAFETTRQLDSDWGNRGKYGTLTGSLDYQRTFNKPDKTFTLSYKLESNPEETKSTNQVIGFINYPSYTQESVNDATGREQTFQVDYYDPVSEKHHAEVGVKFILRQNISESETWYDQVIVDAGNDLDYDQYILGLYAGYLLKLKSFSAKTGMRLERTWNDGVSESHEEKTYFTNRLFNLVPYITISYIPKQGHTVRASYTQRLSRPGIWYLNPYVNNVDSMNVRYGNPSLDSEVSHSFELGYTYFSPKLNLSLTASSAFVNNSIENISSVLETGAVHSTYKNIGENERYGLNGYLNYRPTGKISFFFNGGINYSRYEAFNGYAISNDGFYYRGYLGGRVTIWEGGSINANGGINSSNIRLQGKSSGFYYAGIGFSQYFLKRKLMMSMYANDPFWRKKSFVSKNYDETFNSRNERSYLAQNFRINLTYNFGKMDLKVKKASRSIQNDDLKGGGSSNQGGNEQQ